MLSIEYKSTGELVPYVNNSRTHSEQQVQQVAASIKEFGFTNPILIDHDGGIIAGHGRLQAAQLLNLDEVPTITLEGLTEAQRKAYVIADNQLALNAGWNLDSLKLEVDRLTELDFDISLLGFDDDMLAGLMEEEPSEGLTDEDDVPELVDDPVTVEGDVWILGNHRLMCGDSTSIDAVDKLMDGNKADMVFTDPPYGINHSGKGITANGVKGNNFGQIIGDNDTSIAVDSLNLCLNNFYESILIFWGANYYCQSVPNGFGWLVWDKEREGNTFSGAELAFVNKGVRLDVFRHMWHGMVKASEQGQKRLHPTQKPTALAEWCFKNYGNPTTILDLFGGSGSTLIACEKTNRCCRMMELDPKYCDVIIKRWQDFTGQEAVMESTGKIYSELENEER